MTPNRGIGPPWGAFCQITLTSCLFCSFIVKLLHCCLLLFLYYFCLFLKLYSKVFFKVIYRNKCLLAVIPPVLRKKRIDVYGAFILTLSAFAAPLRRLKYHCYGVCPSVSSLRLFCWAWFWPCRLCLCRRLRCLHCYTYSALTLTLPPLRNVWINEWTNCIYKIIASKSYCVKFNSSIL